MMNSLLKGLGRLNPRFVAFIEKRLKAVPFVSRRIDQEYAGIIQELDAKLKPYREKFETFSKIPDTGREREHIIQQMENMRSSEEAKWKDGFVSGAVYHGDSGHIDFLNKIYALNSQSNPLHSDVWPSTSKFEAEVISMTANMLGAGFADAETGDDGICGVISSGGTESILLAMKAYRDWARHTKKIRQPEMIAPVTAHAAFNKAAQYFDIKLIQVPLDSQYKADVAATRKAITRNTAVIVGSAPSFPHGVIDPIQAMSDLAREKAIGFHTDACLGGFVLPWAEKLGYDVPPFDFRLPGVTSISADTHKFGYAAKGTSAILYRNNELRRYQYFTATDWPGGLYFSPTFAGSRPGALSAACWAALVTIGEQGYLEATRKILETAAMIKKGIGEIPGLKILGDPLFVIAIAADDLDIYKIMDYMAQRNWSLNGLHRPSCVHLCVTLRHTQAGVAQRFLEDLKAAVDYVKENPDMQGEMAPVYGMAANLPFRGVVSDLLKAYMDVLYRV